MLKLSKNNSDWTPSDNWKMAIARTLFLFQD